MTPERWRQVEALFEAALRCPPEERDAFLDKECGGDPGLKSEAQSILKADARAGPLLGTDAQRVQWSREGRDLYYNLHDRDVRAMWRQPFASGSPVQVTHFEEPLHYFDWSFDGKALAVSRSSTLSDVVSITNFH